MIADTSIGEATLRTPERRLSSSGLFTPELSWDNGPGQATIQIDLGIGEVEVRINE